jgi:hypothetical protein
MLEGRVEGFLVLFSRRASVTKGRTRVSRYSGPTFEYNLEVKRLRTLCKQFVKPLVHSRVAASRPAHIVAREFYSCVASKEEQLR